MTALSDSGTGTELEFVPVPDPVNTLMTGIDDSTWRIENAIERGRKDDVIPSPWGNLYCMPLIPSMLQYAKDSSGRFWSSL